MATKTRFLKAADNTRPYKSHRYDVFGLKIERGLTLFGRAALEAWVAIEAEPSVVSYCERPLMIPDTRPRRAVDFWVRFRDREELWLLEREHDRTDGDDPQQLMPALTSWSAANGMAVRFVPPVRDDKSVYLDNWGRIIRELSANRRFVSRTLLGRIQECVTTAISLGDLVGHFSAEDPVLVRTAAFALLHSGQVRCTNVTVQPIGKNSIVEAP